jgi:hypothetical protein
LSFGLMWSLRPHFKRLATIGTAHYPESLGTTAIINSPSFFCILWSWAKACVDFLL